MKVISVYYKGVTIELEQPWELQAFKDILDCAQPHFDEYLKIHHFDDAKKQQDWRLFLGNLLEI